MTTRAAPGIVYILRFKQPIGNPDKKHGMAQYYVGWAAGPKALKRRLQAHRLGYGARITRAFAQQGIPFELIVCFPGTLDDERWVKNYKNTRQFVERESWRRRWNQPVLF